MGAVRKTIELEEADIRRVAEDAARETLEPYGYESVEVVQTTDFDGETVLRIRARVRAEVPARVVIDTLALIRSRLHSEGEERLVFFGTVRPIPESPEEDEG